MHRISRVLSASILPGDAGDNIVAGGNGNDVLQGLAGNDKLYGRDGNDRLDGGSGNDVMWGGGGNDTYVVDSIADGISELAANGVDAGGVDTVFASVNLALGARLENLVLTSNGNIKGAGNGLDNALAGNGGDNVLWGNAGNDRVYGLDGNDRLDGGSGNDAMWGGAGDDVYVVDSARDGVSELTAAGEDAHGEDTVISSISFTLGRFVEKLILAGKDDLNGSGNDLYNTVVGNSGDNRLWGRAGDDILLGRDGNDLLDGGAGRDRMVGGAGNDTYVVDSLLYGIEVVSELTPVGTDAGGIDTVLAYADFTLPQYVENMTFMGTGGGRLTGNALDNLLVGNAGNDRFNVPSDFAHAGGQDTMIGHAGDDLYYVDSSGDIVVERPGEGTDEIISYVSLTLPDEVENVYFSGAKRASRAWATVSTIAWRAPIRAIPFPAAVATIRWTATTAATSSVAAPAPTCLS